MTEPTNQEMREWFDNAKPSVKIRYLWVDILLKRLTEIETVVDKIRYAMSDEVQRVLVLELLELFDADSGDLKP